MEGASSAAPVFTFSSDGRETRALTVLRKRVVPSLSPSQHKGQSGRVLVVGGSENFTGAPYFAAQSSLECGSDLATIACHPSASTPLKAYSPELIVTPSLSDPDLSDSSSSTSLLNAVRRAHCVIVGPGLGRDSSQLSAARSAISFARDASVPLVLDADALWLLTHDLSLASGHSCLVLTPNAVELQRLLSAAEIPSPSSSSSEARQIASLSARLGGATVVKKGREDIIVSCHSHQLEATSTSDASDPSGILLRCGMFGSPRRCGGQGDILCGSIATFLAWSCGLRDSSAGASAAVAAAEADDDDDDDSEAKQMGQQQQQQSQLTPGALAAFGGCVIVRRAAQLAFAKRRRSTGTQDVLSHVGKALDELFPLDENTRVDK